jgi:hypothetical protein
LGVRGPLAFDPTRLSDSEWKSQLDELGARLGDATAVTDRAHGGASLIPMLSKYTGEFRYPDDGWTSGRDFVSDNDRHSYDWGADTRAILEKHAQQST